MDAKRKIAFFSALVLIPYCLYLSRHREVAPRHEDEKERPVAEKTTAAQTSTQPKRETAERAQHETGTSPQSLEDSQQAVLKVGFQFERRKEKGRYIRKELLDRVAERVKALAQDDPLRLRIEAKVEELRELNEIPFAQLAKQLSSEAATQSNADPIPR